MITNSSFEYVVCNRLYKIKYLLMDFVRLNNPCYCKLRLYEMISVFVSKFIIHNVYFIDNRLTPRRSDIFNDYYKYYDFCCEGVSEFLLCFSNKIVSFYYNFIYKSYIKDLEYLFDNYDIDFFEKFIDNIIDKFFENTLILISGINILCDKSSCIAKCQKCISGNKVNNIIKFYLFDEFIESESDLLDLVNYVCSKLDCSETDLIIDKRFLKSKDCSGIVNLYDHVNGLFRSVNVLGGVDDC